MEHCLLQYLFVQLGRFTTTLLYYSIILLNYLRTYLDAEFYVATLTNLQCYNEQCYHIVSFIAQRTVTMGRLFYSNSITSGKEDKELQIEKKNRATANLHQFTNLQGE